jgi:hypothetical protein
MKLTLEINSLTRRLNLWRNVNLRLNPNQLSPVASSVPMTRRPAVDV